MGVMDGLARIILPQRGHMFAWVPVCLGLGIGLYFSIRFEPSFAQVMGVLGLTCVLIAAAWFSNEVVFPLLVCCALIGSGFVLASARSHSVAHPVLSWRYYGAIEGRIIAMDRSASDAVRLTLDQVRLDRIGRAKTPERVRISLHGKATMSVTALPGMRVMTTGHLSPPNGPVEPGGFDFQRHAWFSKLGAVGYARAPLLALEEPRAGASLWIFRTRMAISARVHRSASGDVGGFGAAVTTGDRSWISQEALRDLRASNTAHLLAISGLHMGLLSGFVFGLLRIVLASIPYIALRAPTRKLAAVGAFFGATGYFLLSGGNVSTERAYVMVSVALGAILINRRAISLRAVAIAAIIVLVLRPESLMGPGFQMSFAATTALVAVFGALRTYQIRLGPNWAQPVFAVGLSSLVAGLATAPIGAAHFNTVAHYGLLANLLSVPLMGLVVVPAAVLSAVLAPFGLEGIGLWIMGLGLEWILGVAKWVASLEGARGYVVRPSGMVLPLLALGGAWCVIWQGRSRALGIAPMILALTLWGQSERPHGLIADQANLVGVMTPQGRALSKETGAGFVASNWLENDGDPSSQSGAARRWQGGEDKARRMQLGDTELLHLVGKGAVSKTKDCGPKQLIVASVAPDPPISGCIVMTPQNLRATGAISLYVEDGKLRIVSARDLSGDRIWSGWPSKKAPSWAPN